MAREFRRNGGLLTEVWDGEFAIYDIAAGQTHVLAGAAAAVFSALQEGAARDDILFDAARAGGHSADEAAEALAYLEEIALVRSGPATA